MNERKKFENGKGKLNVLKGLKNQRNLNLVKEKIMRMWKIMKIEDVNREEQNEIEGGVTKNLML